MPPYPKPKPVKRKKRKQHSEYQDIVERLDKLVSQIVHLRDDNTCVICGSTAKPQAGHVFVRGRMKVRWSLWNVHIQCARCNLMHRFDQAPYFHWFIQKYGNDEFNLMYKEAEETPYFKWGFPELQLLEEELTAEWTRLRLERHVPLE
jgi:hypothetical protein